MTILDAANRLIFDAGMDRRDVEEMSVRDLITHCQMHNRHNFLKNRALAARG